jgi:hypothetical protein
MEHRLRQKLLEYIKQRERSSQSTQREVCMTPQQLARISGQMAAMNATINAQRQARSKQPTHPAREPDNAHSEADQKGRSRRHAVLALLAVVLAIAVSVFGRNGFFLIALAANVLASVALIVRALRRGTNRAVLVALTIPLCIVVVITAFYFALAVYNLIRGMNDWENTLFAAKILLPASLILFCCTREIDADQYDADHEQLPGSRPMLTALLGVVGITATIGIIIEVLQPQVIVAPQAGIVAIIGVVAVIAVFGFFRLRDASHVVDQEDQSPDRLSQGS